MDVVQAYRQSEVAGDNPVHLVVLLYDQLLGDLRRALAAFAKQDIPRRCQELDHALLVLGQLQGTLNLESGGEVAQNLDRFYDLVRQNLLRASIDKAPELLEKQLQNILSVREAWQEVERQQTAPATKPEGTEAGITREGQGRQEKAEWKV